MNMDVAKLKEYIMARNKEHIEAAKKYCKICQDYSMALNTYRRILAKRIMEYKAQKKNLGVEMAVIFALADTEWVEHDEFEKMHDKVNSLEYQMKGYKPLLEAFSSEKISIQGLMKYDAEGERFG